MDIDEKIEEIGKDVEKVERDVDHSWAWEMLQQVKSSTHKLWIAFFITLGLLFATNCLWMLLWNQYDYSSTTEYSATGVNAIIDNSGNVVAQDIPTEQLQKILEILNNGNSESEDSKNTNPKE